MVKLKRLKIHKCRSVQPGTELVFNDGLNIVLGKNGAGKTTLLKLIAAAIGSSFADLFKAEELYIEYEYEQAEVNIRCTFLSEEAGRPGSTSMVETLDGSFRLELSSAHFLPITAILRGDSIRIEYGDETQTVAVPATLLLTSMLDLVGLIVTYLDDTKIPPSFKETLRPQNTRLTHRLDEGLDWLRDTLNHLTLSFTFTDDDNLWCMLHAWHMGLAQEFRTALSGYKHRFAELPEILTFHSDQLPFIRQACKQVGLRDASWSLSFLEHTRRKPESKLYGRSQVYVTTKGGTRFPLEKLSFGQLRLFAFFLHSAMHPNVIVADELTNGLHHAMVDACLDTIGERQAFLATQNPLLLDHLGFESAEEVRKTFVLCSSQDGPDGDESTMVWRNMDSTEAAEFFADYQVGVQHTNDILRKRGLW